MYTIILKKSAEKELSKLSKQTQKRIALAIDELTLRGASSAQIKKLDDPLSGFRKRIGNYRLLFDTQDNLIVIHRISKRSEAYR